LKESDTAQTELIGIKEFPNRISKEEKIYYLSLFWSEVKYNFINYDQINFNWDSLYQCYLKSVMESKNDYEYFRLLKKFACSLNDAHTAIYNNNQFIGYLDYAPISLKNIRNKIYIVGYRENILKIIDLGAEVMNINDIQTYDYMVDSILPYVPASTQLTRWSDGVNNILYGLINQPLKITYVNLNSDTNEIVLKRNGESTRYTRGGKDRYKHIGIKYSGRDFVEHYFTDDSIAILSYNRFWPEKEVIKMFEEIVPQLYNAKGLVIDLRNNRGGSTVVAYSLLKYIVKDNFFLTYAWESRINDGVKKAMGYGYNEYKDYFQMKSIRTEPPDTIIISDTIKKFNFPIIILIGNKTMSAAEDFLIMLSEIKDRPIFIGEQTSGSTGSPLVVPGFPGGGYARICTRRCLFPYSKEPFVNKGIQPDIEIIPNIMDIINDNDVVLKRALDEIKAKLD
jgi:hypothetical protein